MMKLIKYALAAWVGLTTMSAYSAELPPQRPNTPIVVVPLPSGEVPTLPSPTRLIRDEHGNLIPDDRMGSIKVRPMLLRTFLQDYQLERQGEEPAAWATFVKACLDTATLQALEQESPSNSSVLYECDVWKITLSQWKKAIVLAIAIKRNELTLEE